MEKYIYVFANGFKCRADMMTDELTPDRTDVKEETNALVIYDGGQVLYRFEKSAISKEMNWVLKEQHDHEEVPPLNLEQAQIEQQTDGGSLQKVTIYASNIEAGSSGGIARSDDGGGTDKPVRIDSPRRGYVIRFSDGHKIPEQDRTIHTTQEDNMGAAVDYLVEEYDLTDRIDIPHYPPRAHKNCTINTEDKQPDGRKMQGGGYQLIDGNYLHTALNKQGKKTRIKDLAEIVDLSVEFLGEW